MKPGLSLKGAKLGKLSDRVGQPVEQCYFMLYSLFLFVYAVMWVFPSAFHLPIPRTPSSEITIYILALRGAMVLRNAFFSSVSSTSGSTPCSRILPRYS